MAAKIDQANVLHRLELGAETSVVLLNWTSARDGRNVCFLEADGRIGWMVRSKFDRNGGPYTRIFIEEGRLMAYRWDGGVYEIDVGTGFSRPVRFEK